MATRVSASAPPSSPRVVPSKPRLRRVGAGVLQKGGRPAFGARHGLVPAVSWDGLVDKYAVDGVQGFLRHKRWVYVVASTEAVQVATAIVDAGPTGTAFVMVTDLRTGAVIADSSRPGATGPMVQIGDRPGPGLTARYRLPGTSLTFHRPDDSAETTVRIRLADTRHSLPGLHSIPGLSALPGAAHLPTGVQRPWLEVDLTLEQGVSPGLTSVAAVRGETPMVTSTCKTSALPVWGEVRVHEDGGARSYSLDGGMGGYDYTNGFLPRRTAWRWAYGTGRLADARPFGINLVSGFSGIGDEATENAVWLDGALVPITSPVRVLKAADDMAPWTVRSLDGSVHLAFTPLACHREAMNLGMIRSRFIQPTGHLTGHVIVEGERLDIHRLPGVVEDQDTLW